MKLTANFSLQEFTRSHFATKNKIPNTPSDKVVERLKVLCEEVLQPVRDKIVADNPGKNIFINITSGYRSLKLNARLKGSATSFHLFGYAADCELFIDGEESNKVLYDAIQERNVFTELVWEYGTDESPDWVHVAYNPADSRKMVKRVK